MCDTVLGFRNKKKVVACGDFWADGNQPDAERKEGADRCY